MTTPDHRDRQPASERFRERRKAREAALQMLYQCEVSGVDAEEAVAAHAEIDQPGRPATAEAREFAARLAIGTQRSVEEIDPIIAAATENWRPSRMAIIDRQILRLAVYQMLHVADAPAVVVINESVELARTFGGDESGRFVNGVLDAIRKKIESDASRT